MGGGHKSKKTSWVATILMILGAALIGLAMVLKSWWLGGAGVAAGVVGFVVAVASNIMEDVY